MATKPVKDVESLRVVLVSKNDTDSDKSSFLGDLVLNIIVALILGGGLVAASVVSTNMWIDKLYD